MSGFEQEEAEEIVDDLVKMMPAWWPEYGPSVAMRLVDDQEDAE